MAESLILLVDAEDSPLRGGTMDEAQLNGIGHRIVRVMIEDGEGSVLLQRRREDDFYMAGKYDNSSSGHVDIQDETDQAAAERELHEELGLGVCLQEIDYYKSFRIEGTRTYNRFNRLFRAVIPPETAIKYDPVEIAGVQWFPLAWLRTDIVENPDNYTPALIDIVARHYTP